MIPKALNLLRIKPASTHIKLLIKLLKTTFRTLKRI